MIDYIANKLEQLSVIEKATFVRKCSSLIKNDWGEIEQLDPWKAWARKRLLVSHQHKFIYCAIPKNASSSLMKSIVALESNLKTEKVFNSSRDTIRKYVEINYALSTYTYQETEQIIGNNYFKFVVVRNPWARLVSTYLNLFVRLHEHGNLNDLVINSAEYLRGRKPINKNSIDINFEEFVRYVCEETDQYLDQHCIPQYLFLGGIKYDFIAHMENLTEDLNCIQNKLQMTLELPKLNVTKYSASSIDINDASTLRPNQLRQLKKRPNYQAFYTPKLKDMVYKRYEKDIVMFNYSFND